MAFHHNKPVRFITHKKLAETNKHTHTKLFTSYFELNLISYQFMDNLFKFIYFCIYWFIFASCHILPHQKYPVLFDSYTALNPTHLKATGVICTSNKHYIICKKLTTDSQQQRAMKQKIEIKSIHKSGYFAHKSNSNLI